MLRNAEKKGQQEAFEVKKTQDGPFEDALLADCTHEGVIIRTKDRVESGSAPHRAEPSPLNA